MMRNLFATYLVLFSAVGAGLTGGCSKPALEGPSREILAGLTIKDIEPVRSEVSLSQVGLRLVTYEMPLENLSSFEKAVGGTGSESIRFAGRKAFEANGLSVGAGPRDSWQKVWAILEKAKTERIRYENLLLFGDLSQEIGDVRIDPKEKLFGGISGSRPAEFAQGSAMLFWQLKARPSEINRSAAIVTLKPACQRDIDRAYAHLTGKINAEQVVFEYAAVETELPEGDFILLGPGPAVKDPDNNTLGGYFFIPGPDKTKLRFYLIVCMKVGE